VSRPGLPSSATAALVFACSIARQPGINPRAPYVTGSGLLPRVTLRFRWANTQTRIQKQSGWPDTARSAPKHLPRYSAPSPGRFNRTARPENNP